MADDPKLKEVLGELGREISADLPTVAPPLGLLGNLSRSAWIIPCQTYNYTNTHSCISRALFVFSLVNGILFITHRLVYFLV